MKKGLLFFLFLFNLINQTTKAQRIIYNPYSGGDGILFADNGLIINTNPRVIGFGEITSVASPFYIETSANLNPALLTRKGKYIGGQVSYRPWLNNIVGGMSLVNVSSFYSFDSSNALGVNFTYFNQGEVRFADEYADPLPSFKPNEVYLNITYSHKFNKFLSFGGGVKLMRFNSFQTLPIRNSTKDKIHNLAIDLGMNYDRSFSISSGFSLNWSTGVSIINFGPRQKDFHFYLKKNFLPTNFLIGNMAEGVFVLDDNLKFNLSLAYQISKYLVPSAPVFIENNGNYSVYRGKDPNISPFKALYQSFYDAPGGFNEELDEISHNVGLEARFNTEKFYIAGRLGHNGESRSLRRWPYSTVGLGIGAWGFYADIFYISSNHPLFNGDIGGAIGFRSQLAGKMFRF